MGAIFGLFNPAGPDLPVEGAQRLAVALANRVSDMDGYWQGSNCALGARIRHSTPESLSERVPAPSPEDGCVIACDARLDNRSELFTALGVAPSGIPDSELILAAYRSWGVACVSKLLGDFAFAIHDPARGELFCARDPFGVRPFCHGSHSGVFCFASDAKALVRARLVDGTPDESRIADFLLRNLQDKSATFYRGVRRLPPAHAMVVRANGVQTWRYWNPKDIPTRAGITDEEASTGFRRLLEEAVRCRLRSAFPVGSFLSGGLDSSSVTLVAAAQLKAAGLPLAVFSAIFPEVPSADERHWMDLVAAHSAEQGQPLQRHCYRADQEDPLDVLDELEAVLDGPGSAVNLYQPWRMLQLARDAGIRVMLTGHDGDTVVSHGFAYLTELALAGDWDAVERELTQIAKLLESYGAVEPSLRRMYVQHCPGILWRRGQYFRALRSIGVLHRRFDLSRRAMLGAIPAFRFLAGKAARGDHSGTPGVHPDFSREPVFRDRAMQPAPPAAASVREDHWQALESGMVTAAFEEFEQVSSACGVESRHPFFDQRLVEFCLSLPREQKIREGWTRVVLRSAMAGVLPETVRLRRDKSNLGDNFVKSLVSAGKRITGAGQEELAGGTRYLDRAAIQRAVERYRASPRSRDALLIYLASGLEAWQRKNRVEPA